MSLDRSKSQPLRLPLAVATLLFLTFLSSPVRAEPIDFVRQVQPILQKHCFACHGEAKQKSNLRLDVKSELFRGGDNYGPAVIPHEPDNSPLIEFITANDPDERMPPEAAQLDAAEIEILRTWIAEGAVWPDGVGGKLVDRRDHWSFKPVQHYKSPAVSHTAWIRSELDAFILAKLESAGLKPAPEADRRTWLRRVYFDLIGLPPTPEQIQAFTSDNHEDAYEKVVEQLLRSPRYGERWAQHWLDVVRYADTHGFEVNTERPNAWPYRDYIIEAFNRDTPYDQFIREQLVGDAFEQDAATGFLITSSVLLPGQIGKDAPSIRLARQDALDEIVMNIGQTFLGLSVGCARCHDHKFDPISAKDYYAMQAFVAGVEYAERELDTPQARVLRARAAELSNQIQEIDRQLSVEFERHEPLAWCGDAKPTPVIVTQPPNAKRNEVEFAPLDTKLLRFTILDTNLHPSLGLIEPCVDEFEIFAFDPVTTSSEQPEARNLALASLGTQVTASGSRDSAIHRLEHINDGKYGNSHSWMSDEAGRGWVIFELPQSTKVHKIVWSRDRDGQFADRTATAFTIEVGQAVDALTRVAHIPPLRPAVNAQRNSDRFAPVETRRIRFSTLATNSLEPCIDELEILDTAGRNVALASRGATVRSSGDNVSPNRHELRLIHDGVYGNSSSWMSNAVGAGEVTVELAELTTIERVVWGRDRDGKFKDRLATNYKIEVEVGGSWRMVASSQDRRPFDPNVVAVASSSQSLEQLSPAELQRVNALSAQKKALQEKIAETKVGQIAFAGRFRKPDDIHLLSRGDPEQPKERVHPAFLTVFGEHQVLEPTKDTADSDHESQLSELGEQQRRTRLADWIASPANPLTARVMVNRIWQGHFGTGLVDTPSDFGRTGSQPSHPELLDWLAVKFIQSGGSIKQLHREIVLSSTYRQSSRFNETAAAMDGDVRLLWRFPPRRLEAETIRDTILAVSGQLNLATGGPGFDLFNQRGGLSGFTPIEVFPPSGLRRLIYAHKVRRERDAVFGAFDCPDAGQSTARRRESTTPIQALNLFNSRFTLDQAETFAKRVTETAGSDVSDQIRHAFHLAFGRGPTDFERTEAESVVREHGLATLCRVIFNSNEFLFLP